VDRHVSFERLHNFRDLGGYPTDDGRAVGWGRVYRSDSLSKLGGADWERFLSLNVRTVIDLRYPWEIDARGRVPEAEGLEYFNFSIEHRPYDQAALASTVDVAPFLAERYAEVASDGVNEIRGALEVLASPTSTPVVFHCASGKDRTGIVAALLLALLGVRDEDIVADFQLTSAATERLRADWRAEHPGRSLVWPGYGRAPAELMRLFLAGLVATYGSARGYAEEALGADADLVEALRSQYLTR